MKKISLLTLALAMALLAVGCSHDMEDGPPRTFKKGDNMNTAGTNTAITPPPGAGVKGPPPGTPGSTAAGTGGQ